MNIKVNVTDSGMKMREQEVRAYYDNKFRFLIWDTLEDPVYPEEWFWLIWGTDMWVRIMNVDFPVIKSFFGILFLWDLILTLFILIRLI